MKLNTVKISSQNLQDHRNKCTLMQLRFANSTLIIEILILILSHYKLLCPLCASFKFFGFQFCTWFKCVVFKTCLELNLVQIFVLHFSFYRLRYKYVISNQNVTQNFRVLKKVVFSELIYRPKPYPSTSVLILIQTVFYLSIQN